MALVKDRALLQIMRGALRAQFTIYERNGQIIMAKKRGESKNEPTKCQQEARLKMQIASALAMEMLKDPEVKAYYQSKAGYRQNAYNMAVKDAYKAPEVQDIRFEECTVVVKAENEFRVAEVEIRVFDADGVQQESGRAELSRNGVDWHYKATSLPKGGRVMVIAVDLPGNDRVITVKV
jgi:hypothetical protein